MLESSRMAVVVSCPTLEDHVPGPLLGTCHVSSYFILTAELGTVIIFTLQMWRLRLKLSNFPKVPVRVRGLSSL